MKCLHLLCFFYVAIIPQSYVNAEITELELGITEGQNGNLSAARDHFENHLKDYPNSPRALRGLGNTYLYIEKDISTAIKYFKKAWKYGDSQALGQLAFIYLSDVDKYQGDLESIQSSLVKNCKKNHLVALAAIVLSDKSNDSSLFKHAYDSIEIKNLENPDNVAAIVYLLRKFGYDEQVVAFVEDVRNTHGDKFNEALSKLDVGQ